MKKKKKNNKSSIILACIFIFCSMIINVNAVSNTETANILSKNQIISDDIVITEQKNNMNCTSSESISNQLFNKYEETKTIPDFVVNGSFSYSYANNSNIDYYLFNNEFSKDDESALLIWLHGSGERNVSEDVFLERGWMPYLKNWDSDCPNMYIICPQITNKLSYTRWNCKEAKNDLNEIINDFIKEHNVNKNKIYIAGHSLGAQGALYMAKEIDIFSACIAISPYNPGNDYKQVDIPIRIYVGTNNCGEDNASISFANTASEFFGKENCFTYNSSHGELPTYVFLDDSDKNNRSDIFEWMISITK